MRDESRTFSRIATSGAIASLLVFTACVSEVLAQEGAVPRATTPPALEVPSVEGNTEESADAMAPGPPVAEVIRSESQLLKGDQAAGQRGDLRLSDGRSVFIISAVDHPLFREDTGGALIDLSLEQTSFDRLGDLRTRVGPNLSHRIRSTDVRVSDDGEAILVDGEVRDEPAITTRTEYRIAPDGNSLVVTTTLTNGTDASLEDWEIGDHIHWGTSVPLLMDKGVLYTHGLRETGRAVLAHGIDFGAAIVTPGSATIDTISHREGTRLIYTKASVLPGESVTCTRHVILGLESMDTVASTVWRLKNVPMGTLRGEVVEQQTGTPIVGAEVLVNADLHGDNRPFPLFRVLTDEDGRYAVPVPAGVKIIPFPRAYSRTRPTQFLNPINIEVGGEAFAQSMLSPPARLDVRVTDKATGEPLPVRIALFTPDDVPVSLGPLHSGEQSGPYIFSPTGQGVYEVPTGRHRVTITHGIEYERHQQDLIFLSGSTREIHVQLERLIDTSGYVAADLGIYTANSQEALISPIDRLRTAAAEGLEFLVSADSAHATNLGEALAASEDSLPMTVAMGERVLPDEGQEIGAWSVFPLPDDLAGESVFAGERFETHRDVLRSIRSRFPRALIACLEPARSGQSPFLGPLGYQFDSTSREYVSETPAEPEDVDFEVMEVLGDRSVNQMRQNLALYHSLLREGHRITLVGSANSRFGGVEEIGYPRTYIAADDSDPRAIDPDEVFESLRRGHAFVTSGPWIEFSIRGNQMGDMFAWEMGEAVEIEYSVKCPGWISLAFIDISKEGNFVQRMTLPGDRSVAPVRVWSPPEGNNKFMVRHDHIFTVEVTGGRPIEPLNPANPGAAQFIPVALSNPIWVDTDGNGRYDHYDYD